MAVVDSLEVEIQAKAKQANKEIDVLCSKLGNLSKQLASVDSKGLTKFSSGLNMLSAGMKGMRDTKMPDFNKTVKGLQKFETLDGQKLAAVSNALNPMAQGLKTLGSVNFNNKNVNSMVSAVARLTSSIQGGVNTQGIISLGNGISQMITTLSSAGEVAPKTASFVNAISRLANAGSKTSASASGLPLLSKELSSFMVSMSSAPVVSKETSELTNAIARLASAGTRTKQTADSLDYLAKKLKDFMVSMQNAPQVSQSTTQLLTAIGNIASAGSRAGSALNSISFSGGNTTNVLSRLGNGFKSVVTRMLGFNKESKNIASSIGMFYAKFFMVIRGVKALGNAIGSIQDYIEQFNYFSVALDKVGKDSENQFKKAGYDSAEAYADSFRTRFAKLQTQMTGFNVDYDTGEATSNMQHNLGLDLTEVMNYNAAISQITNSAGMLGETSIATSKALSMLSADWSSLSNKDLSDVMNNFQSGLIGQSRALYQYGIDTTKAGLAQTALAHGISASVSSMSQQEKMQLRVLTMLEQSKVAYGDLARTINQPANQVRMLQAGLRNLSRTIGQIFLPVVQKLYPYLNAVVMVLQDFAQWVAKLTGAKLYDDTSMATPDYSDAIDGLDDYGDAADKASKKQKKLNDNLQGFDIVNKLQANNKDDGSSYGNKNGNGAGIDLSEDINKAVKGYESIWDKAFKSNKNKAVELATKLKKAILVGWKKGGDYTSLGKSVGSWLTNGLDSIPWAKIQTTTNKLAKSLATFLNGMVQGINWETVGKTLANGFNTVIGALYTFLTKFNWLNLGTSLATGVNSAIKKADMTLAGKTLGAKVRGMIQFAFGFVTNFEFSGLGQKIADGINGFFEEMGEVRKNTGLTGWQELGKTLSDSVKGLADTIITALDKIKWENIGKAIADFLGKLDWIGIFNRLGIIIGKAIKGVIKVGIAAIKEDPGAIVSALTVALGAIFAIKKIKSILNLLKASSIFGDAVGGAISSGVGGIDVAGIFNGKKGLCAKIGEALSGMTGNKAIAVGAQALGEAISGAIALYAAGTIGVFVVSEIEKAINSKLGNNKNQLSLADRIRYATGTDEQKAYGRYVIEQEGLNKKSLSYNDWLKQMKNGAKNSTGDKVLDAGNSIKKMLDKQSKSANEAASANKKLQGIWEKLGVSGTVAKNATSALDSAYKSGKLSLEKYKKITSGSYNTTDALLQTINKIAGKDVEAKVKAVVEGKDGVNELKNSLNETPNSKNVKVTTEVSGKNDLDDIAQKYGDLPTVKSCKVKVSTDEKSINNIKKELNGIKIGTIKAPIQFGITKEQKKILNEFSPANMGTPYANALKKSGMDKLSVFASKLPTYSTGGFPEDGLFMANHGELVGKFNNGKTAVANNDQITTGFAQAITNTLAPAIYAAVSQAVSENQSKQTGDVYLDGTKLTTTIMGKAEQITRSRGSGWKLA